MGRRTYEVVKGFGGNWPYGDTPLLVATTRPLGEPAAPSVSAVSGTPREMLAKAREIAGEKVVYVDGGALIRSLLDEGLIDEMTITVIPVILGDGIPLFAGVSERRRLKLVSVANRRRCSSFATGRPATDGRRTARRRRAAAPAAAHGHPGREVR